jgi:hypothetical protein
MPGFIYKLDFNPDKLDGFMWVIIIGVWLVVLACALGSIFARRPPLPPSQRRFWALVVLFVPIFGVLAYLPFSVKREGYSILRKTKDGMTKLPSAN